MKKKYQEPLMKVVALQRRTHLLAGSGQQTNVWMNQWDTAADNEEGD